MHSVFLWPTTAAAFWCRRYDVPYVVTPHGLLEATTMVKSYEGAGASLASRAKKRLYLWTLGVRDIGGAAALHFVSDAERESTARLRLSPRAHIIVLGADAPPAPKGDDRAAVEEKYPGIRGRKIVLFLSRLHPKKGLDVLAEAAGALAETRDDFSLVIAGGGERGYEREVRAAFDRRGLSGRTVFTGMVAGGDKWRLLRAADVFALPSRHEASPLAVIEATAAGAPVVMSDQVGIHREIDEAGAGLVTTLDPADVARAVGSLLDDPDAAARMGSAGQALASRRYSWERVATDLEALYDEIAGRRAERAGAAAG